MVILEPIVEAMKSPSDKELDSSKYYMLLAFSNFSVNLAWNYVVAKKF